MAKDWAYHRAHEFMETELARDSSLYDDLHRSLAQALREAEARGTERAAKMLDAIKEYLDSTWFPTNSSKGAAEIKLRAIIAKAEAAGTERQPKERT